MFKSLTIKHLGWSALLPLIIFFMCKIQIRVISPEKIYMRSVWFLSIVLVISASAFSQKPNANYDSLLAKKLGADDYGMKSYSLVILKTGSNTSATKTFIDSCFKGHMDNIMKLEKAGKLIVAGPLVKNDKTYRGIFILDVKDMDEARRLVDTDPAVQGNLLAYELFTWYGSAALPLYLESADKIWKTGF